MKAWEWEQGKGMLTSIDPQTGARAVVCSGYSGHGVGKNNRAMQNVHAVGPIPRGKWRIGPAFDSAEHGPHVHRLTPIDGTDTFGRDGFLVHGDSKAHPGEASLGCIVVPRFARDMMQAGEIVSVV